MLMGRGVVALAGLLVTSTSLFAQAVDPGRRAFETRCARCHGADGRGGEMGPAIAERLTPLDDQQLMKLIREGQPLKGMPPNVVPDAEMADLVKFLRTIELFDGLVYGREHIGVNRLPYQGMIEILNRDLGCVAASLETDGHMRFALFLTV